MGTIWKLMGLSVILALVIKYVGPLVGMAPTSTHAVIAVILPTGIMAGILLNQQRLSKKQSPVTLNQGSEQG
jgi:uncharacterized membrane protein